MTYSYEWFVKKLTDAKTDELRGKFWNYKILNEVLDVMESGDRETKLNFKKAVDAVFNFSPIE